MYYFVLQCNVKVVINMTTISLRIDNDLAAKLEKIGQLMERSKSFIARKAIESYIEEIDILTEAKERYEDKKAEYIKYDEFKKEFNNNRN